MLIPMIWKNIIDLGIYFNLEKLHLKSMKNCCN